MKILSVAAVLALLCAAPCAAQNLETPFALKVGESVTLEEPGLTVTFESILYDSRCPRTVVCVWEGVAEIRVSVGKADESPEEVSLFTVTGQPEMMPTESRVDGYVIALVELEPYPMFAGPLQPGIYVATLVLREAARVPADTRSWSAIKSRHSH